MGFGKLASALVRMAIRTGTSSESLVSLAASGPSRHVMPGAAPQRLVNTPRSVCHVRPVECLGPKAGSLAHFASQFAALLQVENGFRRCPHIAGRDQPGTI